MTKDKHLKVNPALYPSPSPSDTSEIREEKKMRRRWALLSNVTRVSQCHIECVKKLRNKQIKKNKFNKTRQDNTIYIYIYMLYVFVCVCVCVFIICFR